MKMSIVASIAATKAAINAMQQQLGVWSIEQMLFGYITAHQRIIHLFEQVIQTEFADGLNFADKTAFTSALTHLRQTLHVAWLEGSTPDTLIEKYRALYSLPPNTNALILGMMIRVSDASFPEVTRMAETFVALKPDLGELQRITERYLTVLNPVAVWLREELRNMPPPPGAKPRTE